LKNTRLLIAFVVGLLNFMIFLSLYSYAIFILADKPYSLSSSWLGLSFLTYLSGTIGSALVGKIDHKIFGSQGIILGTILIMIGIAITRYDNLFATIGALLVNGFGFFIAHSSILTWVNQYAHGAKASATSLYLVFYYLGASAGNTYLFLFWQWQQWQEVVIGATNTLFIPLLAVLWLRKVERTYLQGKP
jgi:YNFM family putative membrane transporter